MRLLKLVQSNAPVGVRGVIAPSLLIKSLELSEDLSDFPLVALVPPSSVLKPL